MGINSKTPMRLAVIGDPIAHSLSPRMHTAAIRKLKLNYRYVAKRVRPNDLQRFVERVKTNKTVTGFNVTLPHKEAILPFLDGVTPIAAYIGAVNTVYWKEGQLWGTNTDAEGFSLALKALKVPLKKKNICVFGAGGASRAVLYALGKLGLAEVFVVNRSEGKAKQLVGHYQHLFPSTHFSTISWDDRTLETIFPLLSFIINTTSIGLKGESFPSLPWQALRKKAIVCDLIYTPLVTPFLRAAKARGLRIQNGTSMFVHQGALAFTTWTKKKAPLPAMRRAVLEAVNKC